jgi:cytosine deaminase
MISHAYCLGMFEMAMIEPLARRLADLRISLMTTAPADSPAPPVAQLDRMGVNLCCGSDGIRDAWTPFGTGDMLERAMLLGLRFDWTKDDEMARALHAATYAGARALGLVGYGLGVGDAADLLLVKAETIGEALALRPLDRLVLRRGRLVAANGRLLDPPSPGAASPGAALAPGAAFD